MTQRTRGILTIIVVLALAGCTTGSEAPSPTPTPPAATPTDQPASGMTVADLNARVGTAWESVGSYRVISVSSQSDSQQGPPTSYTVESWQAPNERQIQTITDNAVTDDQIYARGVVYMRGAFVASAVSPEVGSDLWVTIEADAVPPDSPLGFRVAYLTRAPGSPFGQLTPDLLQEPVTPSGSVMVGDRRCNIYVFGDATSSGTAIRYEVALDEQDRPCQVVQRAGGIMNSSVWEIEPAGLEVVAPLEGTPAVGTPSGRLPTG